MCLYVYIEKKNMIYTCWHPKFKKGKPKLVTLGQNHGPPKFFKKKFSIYIKPKLLKLSQFSTSAQH